MHNKKGSLISCYSSNTTQIIPFKVPLPHILYRWFDVPNEHPNRAEILLYRTVLLDAFYDIAKNCPKAREWLLTLSPDLVEVADYADVTLGQVQSIAASIQSGEIKLPAWRIWRYTWADSQ